MVGMLKALLVQNFSGTQARMKGYYRLRKEPQTAWWCHGSVRSRVIQVVNYDDRFAVVWKMLTTVQDPYMPPAAIKDLSGHRHGYNKLAAQKNGET